VPRIDDISQLKKKQQKKLFKKMNVVGVGIGYKETETELTDELSLKVLVQEKLKPEALSSKDLVPKEFDGIKTDVINVGKVVAYQSPRDKWRPAPAGVSIGHYAITSGTLGMIVRDLRTDEKLILSNNHVLANCNDARVGDDILQPAPADGGKKNQDKIADLLRFQALQYKGGNNDPGTPSNCPVAQFFTSIMNAFATATGSSTRVQAVAHNSENLIDAAVARPINDSVISTEVNGIGQITGTASATPGMQVKKSGRTTGVTSNQVVVIDTSIEVGYGSRVARFEHQIMTNDMSNPGDSGSALLDEQNRVVGLLFSGSDVATFFNPIDTVFSILQVKL